MLDKIKVGIMGIQPNQKELIQYLSNHVSCIDIIAAQGITQSDLVFAKNEMGLQYVYDDHNQLSNNNDVDAIFIWSDISKHVAHAISAIAGNKHVMMQMPLATNIGDAELLLKEAKNRPSQSTFCPLKNRFNPIFLKANEMVDKGTIGIPVMAQLYSGKKSNLSESEKMSLNHRSIFIDLALDEIDLVHWLFGKNIESVQSVGTIAKDKSLKLTNDVDTAQVQASLSEDFFAQFSFSRFPMNTNDSRLFIQGTKASLLVDRDGLQIIHENGIDKIDVVDLNTVPNVLEATLVHDFCQQIQNRQKSNHSLDDVFKTTQVAVAMAKSLIMEEKITL